ncbi:MAG: hypothetical protein ACKVQS_12965 [Fimbriimonadaceae bacterium]
MVIRQIGPETAITGGTTHAITVGDSTATLFIPAGFNSKKPTSLWLHFHTADWFIIQEYQRANYNVPILNFNLGQGSTVYGKPFIEKGTLQPFLKQAEEHLQTRIENLNFTSFSAGFGAVRNLIQDPEILAQLKTVIQCDSIYGSLDPAMIDKRAVLPDHIKIWQPLIDRALSNKTTVIFTTSQITPETYAGSWEVVQAIVNSNGGTMKPADPNSPATKDPNYPLLRTFDKAGLHIWSYEGTDAMAHMTHPRHLAELLKLVK